MALQSGYLFDFKFLPAPPHLPTNGCCDKVSTRDKMTLGGGRLINLFHQLHISSIAPVWFCVFLSNPVPALKNVCCGECRSRPSPQKNVYFLNKLFFNEIHSSCPSFRLLWLVDGAFMLSFWKQNTFLARIHLTHAGDLEWTGEMKVDW